MFAIDQRVQLPLVHDPKICGETVTSRFAWLIKPPAAYRSRVKCQVIPSRPLVSQRISHVAASAIDTIADTSSSNRPDRFITNDCTSWATARTGLLTGPGHRQSEK